MYCYTISHLNVYAAWVGVDRVRMGYMWLGVSISRTCPPGKAASEESFISFCNRLSSLVVDPLTFGDR